MTGRRWRGYRRGGWWHRVGGGVVEARKAGSSSVAGCRCRWPVAVCGSASACAGYGVSEPTVFAAVWRSRVPACAAVPGSGPGSGAIAVPAECRSGISSVCSASAAGESGSAESGSAGPTLSSASRQSGSQCRRRLWSGTGLFPTTVSATIRWSE